MEGQHISGLREGYSASSLQQRGDVPLDFHKNMVLEENAFWNTREQDMTETRRTLLELPPDDELVADNLTLPAAHGLRRGAARARTARRSLYRSKPWKKRRQRRRRQRA
jgi:hypothetical protein